MEYLFFLKGVLERALLPQQYSMSFSPFAALLLINLNCFFTYFTTICHYPLTTNNKLLRDGDCNHVAQTLLGHQSDWSQPQINHAFVWNRPKLYTD